MFSKTKTYAFSFWAKAVYTFSSDKFQGDEQRVGTMKLPSLWQIQSTRGPKGEDPVVTAGVTQVLLNFTISERQTLMYHHIRRCWGGEASNYASVTMASKSKRYEEYVFLFCTWHDMICQMGANRIRPIDWSLGPWYGLRDLLISFQNDGCRMERIHECDDNGSFVPYIARRFPR